MAVRKSSSSRPTTNSRSSSKKASPKKPSKSTASRKAASKKRTSSPPSDTLDRKFQAEMDASTLTSAAAIGSDPARKKRAEVELRRQQAAIQKAIKS